jgi:hypothetical protein
VVDEKGRSVKKARGEAKQVWCGEELVEQLKIAREMAE